MADRIKNIDRIPINEVAAGTHLVLAGEAGYEIVLVGLVLSTSNDNQIAWTLITLQDQTVTLLDIYLGTYSNIVLPECNTGWLRCAAGERLDIVLGQDVNVGGVALCRKFPTGMEM